MDTLIQIQDRGVITIPKALRKAWDLSKGDFLNIRVNKNKEAILNPVVTIDRDILQASQKALKDLRDGKVAGPFSSMDEFKKSLKK